jgi:hypothetical protein
MNGRHKTTLVANRRTSLTRHYQQAQAQHLLGGNMIDYQFNDPAKGQISYTDLKRHWWLISVFMPLLPLSGVIMFYQTGEQAMLLLPLCGYIDAHFGLADR